MFFALFSHISQGVLALWAAYLAFLKNNPILAKQVTASFTNFIGDLLAQSFTKK